jgi:hypothetical protein
MGTKFHGLIVKVLRLMDDAYTFHDAVPSVERRWNKTSHGDARTETQTRASAA